MTEVMADIGDDFELIKALRSLYDWGILANILVNKNNSPLISKSKVKVYEQHREDLANLKYLVHKYIPYKYNEVFRELRSDNYVAYSYHYELKNDEKMGKKADLEKFSKFLLKILVGISVEEEDKVVYDNMIERLTLRLFT